MNKVLYIILISLFSFTIISCAKESDSSSSSTATTMSTPSISDGNYKLTAAVEKIYYSDGTHYGTTSYTVSHNSSVTPGYLAYVLEWKGSGIYRVTVKGKAILSASGATSVPIDCTTNSITDATFDTDGNMTKDTTIQIGCGGDSSSLSDVSDKFTVITGGFQHYAVLKDSSSNQYRVTYTFQKQ